MFVFIFGILVIPPPMTLVSVIFELADCVPVVLLGVFLLQLISTNSAGTGIIKNGIIDFINFIETMACPRFSLWGETLMWVGEPNGKGTMKNVETLPARANQVMAKGRWRLPKGGPAPGW
jgi:hypothetical protein